MNFALRFEEAATYNDFLEQYGSEEHRRRWRDVYDKISLSDAQVQLIGGFQRQLNVLCMAGTWCGDCVQQCPIFARFAEVNSCLEIRFVDRDADEELQQELLVCGGARVPAVVFLNEDGQAVGRYGDRTLSKYRQMASEQLGASCPSGIFPPDQPLLDAVVQDWLNEFERLQLMLRTSPRLREKHGD